MDLYDKLKKYFNETPKEQVLKDWEETKIYDNINYTTIDKLLINKPKQFLCGNEYRNKEKRCAKQCGNCQGNV